MGEAEDGWLSMSVEDADWSTIAGGVDMFHPPALLFFHP
jgi:hypothetical protein